MTDSAKTRAASAKAKALAIGAAHVARLHNRAMAALLLLLVAAVFVLPAAVPSAEVRNELTEAVLVLILISGLVAVLEHRRLAVALAVLSAIVVVLHSMEWLLPHELLPTLRTVMTMLAFAMLAVAVGINVFAPRRAIADRVFGAIVLYLLLGLVWGVIYATIEMHAPGSFAGTLRLDERLSDWVYYSFVTLTTVGYGDITPLSMAARAIAMLEALVGQLYPAIIIARLVSLQGNSR
ncbi:MAG: ion channel [Betaproteobacteria bacterium]|jgi:hypothetical protein|nr:ion channel [Betaproteobacteria bacterium]